MKLNDDLDDRDHDDYDNDLSQSYCLAVTPSAFDNDILNDIDFHVLDYDLNV